MTPVNLHSLCSPAKLHWKAFGSNQCPRHPIKTSHTQPTWCLNAPPPAINGLLNIRFIAAYKMRRNKILCSPMCCRKLFQDSSRSDPSTLWSVADINNGAGCQGGQLLITERCWMTLQPHHSPASSEREKSQGVLKTNKN